MKKPRMHALPSPPQKRKRKGKSISMATHQTEDSHESAQIYGALGLVEPRRGSHAPPRALSLVASALRRSIRKNEKFIQTSSRRKTTLALTNFHGSTPPSLTVEKYLERIFKYANCSPSCFVVAYLYMDRYLMRVGVRLTSLNVHRLLITATMLAAKFMDDRCHDNAYYARIGGLSREEMNSLELRLLFDMDFRLHVTVETFRRCCLKLEEEADGNYYRVKESGLLHPPLQGTLAGQFKYV